VDPELMSATVQPTSSLVARLFDSQLLASKHGLAQTDQRTVGIDNLGLGALREGRPVGMLPRYQDRNRQQDSLAAPLLGVRLGSRV
jgi:hypothetical protein